MTPSTDAPLTCVLCGCMKEAEFFDGWRSALSSPGMSGKVDADRPECDFCDNLRTSAEKLDTLIGELVRFVGELATRVAPGSASQIREQLERLNDVT